MLLSIVISRLREHRGHYLTQQLACDEVKGHHRVALVEEGVNLVLGLQGMDELAVVDLVGQVHTQTISSKSDGQEANQSLQNFVGSRMVSFRGTEKQR